MVLRLSLEEGITVSNSSSIRGYRVKYNDYPRGVEISTFRFVGKYHESSALFS